MESDLQSLLETGVLPANLIEKIKALTPGAYCTHKSWGFGKIREWNVPLDQVVIDFKTKPGHGMKFQYAAESLLPLSPTHINVQKTEDPAKLKARTESDQVGVMRDAILSLGTAATGDAIEVLLCPDVIPASGWKKWWESSKKALKKDGHFLVPARKTEVYQVLESATALHDRAIEDFRAAIGPKAQLITLIALSRKWSDINQESIAQEVLAAITETLSRTPTSQMALKVDLALARDEFVELARQAPASGPTSTVAIVPTKPKSLGQLIDQLPAPRQTQLIETLRNGYPEYEELFLQLIPGANARVAEAITEAFEKNGRTPIVAAQVNKLIRERNITSDFLYWLCKTRAGVFGQLFEPQLMLAILSVLERDLFGETKKGTKLYELIISDRELIAIILKTARPEDVRDITRAILLTPVFEELDKRSFLAKIIKLYPDIQEMITGGNEKSEEEGSLIVSWESLERRKAELDEITNKKIPQNIQDIKIARGYGDLRENFEFKSAKEMKTVLERRKAELESMLTRAQGTDFSNTDTTTINLGTIVSLKDNATGQEFKVTILGAWDSDPANGIVSYLTAMGRALIGHKVGETVEILDDEAKARFVTVLAIEPFKKG
jgi:transcription elongation GreA/GreB family factor/transcription elongation factor GreA-like protein